MALYRYVKAQPQIIPLSQSQTPSLIISTGISFPRFKFVRQIPYILMAFGLLLILNVAAPIIYHELVVFPLLRKPRLLSPLPKNIDFGEQIAQVAGVTESPENSSTTTSDVDYTQVNNWFPTLPSQNLRPSKITHYSIDIPSLDIKNAVVEIGGENLKSNLVQYAETANPGEYGAPVIFGHSILRQFYNPKESNDKRYMSIFSTIMTLEEGDEIYVNFDGIQYTYRVDEKYEVTPDQVEVLQQRYDHQRLKLITCTPEGTYLRRGVIEANLVPTTT